MWPNSYIFSIFLFFFIFSTIFSIIAIDHKIESIILGFSIFVVGMYLDMSSSKNYLKYESNILLKDICSRYGLKKGISLIISSEIVLVTLLIPVYYWKYNFIPSAFFGIIMGSIHIANYIGNIRKIPELETID